MPNRSTHRHPAEEPSDIDSRRIVWIGVVMILVVVIASTLIGVSLHGRQFGTSTERAVQPRYLQSDPRADRFKIEQDAEERLLRYSNAEEKGYARIPIDRAMQLLSTRP